MEIEKAINETEKSYEIVIMRFNVDCGNDEEALLCIRERVLTFKRNYQKMILSITIIYYQFFF